MSPPSSKEPVSSGGSRQFWLFLLLIVLIVALVVYDHGAVRHYGQQAYSKAERATQKASNWAKNLYACGIPGCGPKSGKSNITSPEQPGPDKVAVAEPNTNATPAVPSAPATDTGSAAVGPDTQTTAPPANAPAGEQSQTSAVINYPAYPPYPAYPNYPPDSSFGQRSFGGDSAPPNGAGGETPPTGTAPAVTASQPALPYLPPSPPRPPKPEAAPGKPEYPDYPAYPQNPSVATPPMMPPAAMAPSPRASRPDQRAAPLAGEAMGVDGLAQARKSAQAGRMNESVREYLLYLRSQPNDVDAYGELGNVYMKMGRFPEAAQNYYEAATRLIDAGHLNAVASLMPVIQMHEPMLATLLNKKIANASAGNQGDRR